MTLDPTGGGGTVRIDHDEYENGAEKLSRRARGKDPFTQAFDSVLRGAEKAVKKVATHVTDGVPGGIRASSRNHQRNEQSIVNDLNGIGSRTGGREPNSPSAEQSPGGAGHSVPGRSDRQPSPELSVKGREAGKMPERQSDRHGHQPRTTSATVVSTLDHFSAAPHICIYISAVCP